MRNSLKPLEIFLAIFLLFLKHYIKLVEESLSPSLAALFLCFGEQVDVPLASPNRKIPRVHGSLLKPKSDLHLS
jgi:hypothetical protein